MPRPASRRAASRFGAVDVAFILAHGALAVGFGTGAILRYLEVRRRNGAAEATPPFGSLSASGMPAPLPTGGGTSGPVVAREHQVRSIDQRVALIVERARHGGKHPDVRQLATEVLTERVRRDGRVAWKIRENDWRAENVAIFNAIRDPGGKMATRYVRDPLYAELFQHPRVALDTKATDCDDQVILLGAALLAVGHPVKLRVVWFVREPTWGHIYLVARDDIENAASWQPLDLTPIGRRGRKMPPGWEVPGASEALRSGRASGYARRVKEYVV